MFLFASLALWYKKRYKKCEQSRNNCSSSRLRIKTPVSQINWLLATQLNVLSKMRTIAKQLFKFKIANQNPCITNQLTTSYPTQCFVNKVLSLSLSLSLSIYCYLSIRSSFILAIQGIRHWRKSMLILQSLIKGRVFYICSGFRGFPNILEYLGGFSLAKSVKYS